MTASSASISWGGSFSARPVSTTIRPAWLHHYLPRSPPLQPPHRPAPGQAAHDSCVSSWPPPLGLFDPFRPFRGRPLLLRLFGCLRLFRGGLLFLGLCGCLRLFLGGM